MNTIDTMSAAHLTSEHRFPQMTQKLGKTTFEVYVHFSETSKETLTDKVMRLIRNDINRGDMS
ncbi:MAG: transposon-encoded TnpW family protein [Clostridium sp.]|nr:transposon-encoded TnpW family protein [Clostridium sp.]